MKICMLGTGSLGSTIGGLIYGTLLTLLVVPCIYGLFNRSKKKEKKAD